MRHVKHGLARPDVVIRVLAAAGDAGGARALLPVIRRLNGTPGIRVVTQAYAAAGPIWRAAGLLPGAISPEVVADADRLLLGSSMSSEQSELTLLRLAQERGVRSVSVLDFWIHYRERFLDCNRVLVLPDVIAVMDTRARQEMVSLGFPADRLVVTGQPAYDDLEEYRTPERRDHARTWVEALGRGPDTDTQRAGGTHSGESEAGVVIQIVFASQPLSLAGGKAAFGFDEAEVLHDVLQALTSLLTRHEARARLLVKLHPREQQGSLIRASVAALVNVQYPPGPLTIRVLEDGTIDARRLVLGSDLVVGMNSTLLMEACLLQVPVLSFQPHLRIPDPLPANALGWSRAVYEPEALAEALEQELISPEGRERRVAILANTEHVPDATGRVVRELLSTAGDPSRMPSPGDRL